MALSKFAEKQMRTQISLQEKLEIYEYRQKNSAISFNNIANFFFQKMGQGNFKNGGVCKLYLDQR